MHLYNSLLYNRSNQVLSDGPLEVEGQGVSGTFYTKDNPMTNYKWLLNTVESVGDSDDCIEWPFGRDSHGYGVVFHKGRNVGAHKMALQIATGTESDLQAAHKPVSCHNRACVNPNHLEWKTRKANQQDRVEDGTSNRKFTEEQVRLVCALYESGNFTQSTLAEEFGTSRLYINSLVTGRRWGHLWT